MYTRKERRRKGCAEGPSKLFYQRRRPLLELEMKKEGFCVFALLLHLFFLPNSISMSARV